MRTSYLGLTLLLLATACACALGLVSSQHKARKLFVELEHGQERARSLDVEYGQLQLEQSTWAMHARVEKIATGSLRMRAPEAKRTQIVVHGAPAGARREAGETR
jgi:cell division protein FtsL